MWSVWSWPLLCQKLVKLAEPPCPERSLFLHPLRHGLQRFGIERKQMLAPALAASDQVGSFQKSDVLGNGVQRNRKGRGNIGDPRLAGGQPSQDRPAGRIGQGGQRVVESKIFIHLDEYNAYPRVRKPLGGFCGNELILEFPTESMPSVPRAAAILEGTCARKGLPSSAPDRAGFQSHRVRCRRRRRRACPGDPDLLGTEPELSKYAGASPAENSLPNSLPARSLRLPHKEGGEAQFPHGRDALRDAI